MRGIYQTDDQTKSNPDRPIKRVERERRTGKENKSVEDNRDMK